MVDNCLCLEFSHLTDVESECENVNSLLNVDSSLNANVVWPVARLDRLGRKWCWLV